MQVFLNEDGSEMELGRGGFGVVLRGTYRMAPVAIKRLKDQSLEQQEIFMREMALLRGCRGSRYIVPFVGASLQPVIPFPSLIPARADQWPSSGGSVSEAAGGFHAEDGAVARLEGLQLQSALCPCQLAIHKS